MTIVPVSCPSCCLFTWRFCLVLGLAESVDGSDLYDAGCRLTFDSHKLTMP